MRHACVSHAAGLVSTTVSGNHASAVQSNGGGIVDEADATLTLINSRVTGKAHPRLGTPRGEPVGANAALCACGDVPLTLEYSRNALTGRSVRSRSSSEEGAHRRSTRARSATTR